MAEPRIQVELSTSFIERLASIKTFLAEADAPRADDKLLDGLRRTVTEPAPLPAHRAQRPGSAAQSTEAMMQLAAPPPGAVDALREYLHGDYNIHYTRTGSTVYLLSIRHHRQLTFAFAKLWQP